MDIRVLRMKGVLPVSGFFMLTRVPPVVAITGNGFGDVKEVFVNGVEMKSFHVQDDRLILVGLPSHMTRPATSVRVTTDKLPAVQVSPDHTVVPVRSRLSFSLGTRLEGSSGIDRLVQLFVKVLTTTPGRDIRNPDLGGGVQTFVGAPVSSDRKEITRSLAVAVGRTTDQVVDMQAKSKVPIPSSERLLSAVLLGSSFSVETTVLSAVISLSSFDREQAVASMAL